MIDDKHAWFLPENFIEKTENDPSLLYADTDSTYLLIDLPFDKYEDIHQLVDYVQKIARELDIIYNEALEHYLCNFGGLNKEYNTMDFKSEVIAYKGFFNTKKFYALAKVWDEGTFFEDNPKLKITGGQIKKSDVTQLTKALLTDVYSVIVTDISQNNLHEMYRIIFVQLKNKYKMQIRKDIEEMDFKSFAIPKKWGNTAKTIPPFVTGAKLYNSIVNDTFRPGDAFIVVKIKINVSWLINYFMELDIPRNEFALQSDNVIALREKINVISIPPDMSADEKQKLLVALKAAKIELDYNEIVDSNIDSKLEPFEKLFPTDVRLQSS